MSKKAVEHHHKAAEHHEHAARHHKEAAKHHETGRHETERGQSLERLSPFVIGYNVSRGPDAHPSCHQR
jgi:hypothetical protein